MAASVAIAFAALVAIPTWGATPSEAAPTQAVLAPAIPTRAPADTIPTRAPSQALPTARMVGGVLARQAAPPFQELICVQVVIDFGSQAPGKAPSRTCVPAGAGDSGAQILSKRAWQLGKKQPIFDSNGFLCSIDGIPVFGGSPPLDCSSSAGGYWSYWHKQGDEDWSYSSAGAYQYSVSGTQAGEGWSWSDGPQRKPINPRYVADCPPGFPPYATPQVPRLTPRP
jgi:hypothetical protein